MTLNNLPRDIAAARILDTKSAATFLGLAPVTLRRMISEGTAPPCIRIGVRKWGFRLGDLAAWGGVKRDGSAA